MYYRLNQIDIAPQSGVRLRPLLRILLLLMLLCAHWPGLALAQAGGAASVSASGLAASGAVDLASRVDIRQAAPGMTLAQIMALAPDDWQQNRSDRTNFGQTSDAYWFRIRVTDLQEPGEAFYLRLNYANLDLVDAYLTSDGRLLQHYQAGDTVPYAERPVDERILLFPLHQWPVDTLEVYLRAASEGPLEVPLDLVTRTEFDRQEKATFIWVGMYFGIMGIMFFYNLLVYLVVRDRAYLIYITYVACTAFLQFSLRGFGFQFLWPESTTLNNQLILLFSCLMPLAAVSFVREFLKLEGQGSPFDIWSGRAILFIFSALFVCSFFLPYFYVLKTVHIFAFVTIAYGFYVGLKYWLKGLRAARIFTIAWFTYMIFAVLYLLEITGVGQTNPVTKYALEIGSALELMLLSLAFGDRINHEKESIAKLLGATKALSASADRIAAVKVATRYLEQLSQNIELRDVVYLLPQQDGAGLLPYPLWRDGREVDDPRPMAMNNTELAVLRDHRDSTLMQHELFIPIHSEKKRYGYLRVNRFQGNRTDLLMESNLIASVIHSLSLTLESIELEEKDRLSAIGAMAAAIVHDLKNPIGAIKGCAELAGEPSNSEQERSRYLTSIVSETLRMQAMAQEVLEFSRGEMVLRRKVMSAREFLDDMNNSLSPMLGSAGVGYDHSCRIEGCIDIDADRIRRVIYNLVTNARDAMLAQGTTNPFVTLRLLAVDNGLQIRVSDNGPGIPESIRDTLFEPFVTQGKAEGTGLGMAIVRKIVAAHGGDICFETGDKGTDFIIDLPECVKAQAECEQIITNQQQVSGDGGAAVASLNEVTVLMAEDNPVNQLVVNRYLKGWGMSVVSVTTGQQALEVLQSHTLKAPQSQQIQVILMDVEMPEMDGLEATREIRRNSALQHLPVIGLTGHSDEQQLRDCREAGMDQVICKPIDKPLLKATLLSVLTEQRPH